MYNCILQTAQVAAQNNNNADITDALDEITDEIISMQLQGKDTPAPSNGTGGSQRTVISDIEKLKKIAQILETVGQAVLPSVVDGQVNAQNAETNSVKASASSEPVKILPKGLKLLQHHNSLASNLNDQPPSAPDARTE